MSQDETVYHAKRVMVKKLQTPQSSAYDACRSLRKELVPKDPIIAFIPKPSEDLTDDDLTFVIFWPDEKPDVSLEMKLEHRVKELEASANKREQDHRDEVQSMYQQLVELRRTLAFRRMMHNDLNDRLGREVSLRQILMAAHERMQRETEEKAQLYEVERSRHRQEQIYRMNIALDAVTRRDAEFADLQNVLILREAELKAVKDELRVVKEELQAMKEKEN